MKHSIKILYSRAGDLLLLFKTFILMGLIRLGMRLLPFAALRQLLATITDKTSFFFKQNQIAIARLIWAVNKTSQLMPGNVKCLARALTTEVLMNQHGYAPQLRIGVAKGTSGKLEAHAWIESSGKVLIGQLEDLARFQVLPLPSWRLGK